MKTPIFIILILLVLSGCASVSMTKNVDGSVTWDSKTLWKDINQVDAQSMSEGGSFTFGMGGSSNSMTPEQTQMLMCLLNPTMCK